MTREHVEGGTKSRTQVNNEENNPCWKEHRMSLRCMSDSNYNSEECQLQFQNYRTCREFWTEVQRQRRLKGIRPLLPPLEERKSIKAKYMETGEIII
ncbi:hypothetical protein GE061_015488 [Apolygus lucorum]|uniref:Coiled-coil-helix-coiled-coil-helix domain-containing protein 7 n=1 Tax=Apolygus lucorum TaxID=248454 RepID=A0A8S9XM95_APOLU|nr:hypothetical protein GE061_015488 [Apolygus lucorum]